MKKFIFLFVLPVSVIYLFFSGALPYTLIYEEDSLNKVNFVGDKPVFANVTACKVQDTKDLYIGADMETTYRVRLINNTDRFVAISAIGEVFSPTGNSAGMHSKFFILNPNAEEEIEFTSLTTITRTGRYKCKVRYAIGRFEY